MDKFFPTLLPEATKRSETDKYCSKYHSHLLTGFTSSLYIAAALSSVFVAPITSKLGRKVTMFVGGVVSLVGAAVSVVAANVWMLIASHVFIGFGIGFVNQVCESSYELKEGDGGFEEEEGGEGGEGEGEDVGDGGV